MPTERITTLIIGGGQAGLAMSHMLSQHGCMHLVVERGRSADPLWHTVTALRRRDGASGFVSETTAGRHRFLVLSVMALRALMARFKMAAVDKV